MNLGSSKFGGLGGGAKRFSIKATDLYNDAPTYTTWTANEIIFCGENGQGEHIYLCSFRASIAAKLITWVWNPSLKTGYASTAYTLNTYNDSSFIRIAGQSRGAYSFNTGMPVTITSPNKLFAIAATTSSAGNNTYYGVSIGPSGGISPVTSTAVTVSNNNPFIDNLDTDNWVVLQDPTSDGIYRKLQWSGTGAIVDQFIQEDTVSATKLDTLSNQGDTFRCLGDNTGENAHIAQIGLIRDGSTTSGSSFGTIQLSTDSTTWSYNGATGATRVIPFTQPLEATFIHQLSANKVIAGGNVYFTGTDSSQRSNTQMFCTEITYDTSSPYTTAPSLSSGTTLTVSRDMELEQTPVYIMPHSSTQAFMVELIERTRVTDSGGWISGGYDQLRITPINVSGTTLSLGTAETYLLDFEVDQSQWAQSTHRLGYHEGHAQILCQNKNNSDLRIISIIKNF